MVGLFGSFGDVLSWLLLGRITTGRLAPIQSDTGYIGQSTWHVVWVGLLEDMMRANLVGCRLSAGSGNIG